jgi:hypothetical protein
MTLPTTLKNDAARITLWAIFLPALAFWPFISAFPAIGIISGGGTLLTISIQAVLFMSGFWGVAATALAVWLLLGNQAEAGRFSRGGTAGLLLGAYATLWTGLYLVFFFASR